MCGLFGWISSQALSGKQNKKSIDACFEQMHRRGPDDQGVLVRGNDYGWVEDPNIDASTAVLAHVRLSILDLSSRGHQPMVSRDDRYRIAYNGEVYNYRELRVELEQAGFDFKTDTDTEVVLQALSYWGMAALSRFIGMFAIALHDEVEQKLYLIRDFFGIKPLFYTENKQGMLGFASELPAILAMPNITKKVNKQRLYDYLLFGDYDSAPETMVKGIKHVLPGHYLVIDTKQAEIVENIRYWKPELMEESKLTFSDSAEEIRALFLDNIRLHLRSDVSLGAALSGGVDSSAVTAAIRHVEPDFDLKTFTYVASGSAVNEEEWADTVIQKTQADPYKVSISANEMVSDLDELIMSQGEPFGSTSIYAQYRVFKLAKEAGVKVTLDGQGADELFAGYLGFPGERLKSLLMQGDILGAWSFFNATSRWPDRNKTMVFKRLISVFTPKPLYSLFWSVGLGSIKPSWLNLDWFNEQHVDFTVPRVKELTPKSRYVHQALATQLTQRGLPALLRHGDRNSMHFSIESRVPFLTKELAETVLSMPEEYLIANDGTTKAVFKEAMRGIVPDQVLDRKDKVGFATPERQWLEQLRPWVEETLSEASYMSVFNQDELRKTWQEIMLGTKEFDWQVWRWLNFIRWAKLFDIDLA